MKKAVYIFSLMFLGLTVLMGCAQKAQEGTILAEFDKGSITLEELDKKISELPEWKQDKYKDKTGKEEYLNEVLENRLILQVAIEKGMDSDPKIIKQTQEYKDQLVVKEIVKREIDDKVKVGEPDIAMYYEAHKADYVEPEKVAVTEITLEDEAKANDIFKRVTEGGEDYTNLAKEMSDKAESVGPGQGNVGKTTFSKDSFSQAREFVEKSFALEPGQIIQVTQPMGEKTYYMIVRLDERIPEKQLLLDEVKDRIQSIVEREKKKELMNKWLDDLKAKKKFRLFADRITEPPKEEEKAVEETTEEAKPEDTGEQAEQKSPEPTEEAKPESENTEKPQ